MPQRVSRARRVVVLEQAGARRLGRRHLRSIASQAVFAGMVELKQGFELYEYAGLVTSLSEEVLSIAQLYRDRAEAENIFDELKNQ